MYMEQKSGREREIAHNKEIWNTNWGVDVFDEVGFSKKSIWWCWYWFFWSGVNLRGFGAEMMRKMVNLMSMVSDQRWRLRSWETWWLAVEYWFLFIVIWGWWLGFYIIKFDKCHLINGRVDGWCGSPGGLNNF